MKDVLNTQEAAKHIGFSAGTLEVWRQQDRGPKYMKVSGKVFYKIKDLEKFVENGGNK